MAENTSRKKRKRGRGPNAGQFGPNGRPQPKKQTLTEEEYNSNVEEIRRHKKHVWTLASDKPGANPTPGRLRPLPTEPTDIEKLVEAKKIEDDVNVQGQRLVLFSLLAKLINDFLSKHSQEHPRCSPLCAFPTSGETRRGFACEESLTCTKCGFVFGPVKLYEEAERFPGRKRGRKPAKTNVKFAVALTKLGIGVTGAKTLLSCMDMLSPSLSTMQCLVTDVCDNMEEFLESALDENKGKVRQALQLRGLEVKEGEPAKFAASVDTCYNNPCYYGVSQKATQASMPIYEEETKEQLLVGHQFVNQLCKGGEMARANGEEKPCPGHEGHCSCNFDADEAIGNAEKTMGERAALDLLSGPNPLAISTLICDNDGKTLDGIQETYDTLKATHHARLGMEAGDRCGDAMPSTSSCQEEGEGKRVVGGDVWNEGITVVKEDCYVHVSRGQRKAVFKLKLSPQIVYGMPLPSGCKKGAPQLKKTRFCQVLSHALSRRCHTELVVGRARHPIDDDKFVNAVTEAKNNILDCFSGNHSKCKRVSFACKARPNDPAYKPCHLPWQKSLSMTDEDREQLMTAIEYKLSPKMILRQRSLRSTNKCEAHHLRTHKSLPKSKTFKRNAPGRAASAAHSAAVGGMGESVAKITKRLGCNLQPGGPGSLFLRWADRKAKSDKLRQRGPRYRGTKAASRWRKEKKKKGSGYKAQQLHPNFCQEHSYSEKND